jgi:hypothetical protein
MNTSLISGMQSATADISPRQALAFAAAAATLAAEAYLRDALKSAPAAP